MQYLGEPTDWLDLLNRQGVLALITNDISLWQRKPIFNDPRISMQRFNRASDLLVAAVRIRQISWIDFCNVLQEHDHRMASSLKKALGLDCPRPLVAPQSYAELSAQEQDLFDQLCAALVQRGLPQLLKQWVIPTRDRLPVDQYGGYGQPDFPVWLINGFHMSGVGFCRRIGAVIVRQGDRAQILRQLLEQSHFANVFFGSPTESAPTPAPAPAEPIPVAGQPSLSLEEALRLIARSLSSTIQAEVGIERQPTRVKSVLRNVKYAEKINEFWPDLLPKPMTLLAMLEAEPNLASWIVFLVAFAETKLGVNPLTFPLPNGDLKVAMQYAMRASESVPFPTLAVYDLSKSADQRMAEWRERFSVLVNLSTLQEFLGETNTGYELDPEEQELMFDELMKNIERDPQLKQRVLAHVIAKIKELDMPWATLNLADAPKHLFAPSAPVDQQVRLATPKGWAEKTLADLAEKNKNPSLYNPAVLAALRVYDNNPSLLLLASRQHIESLLAGYPDLFCKLSLMQELVQQGKIKA